MDNHPIPQDVTGFQFRLIGDMTIKQFAYLAAGLVLAWICLSLPIIFLLKFPFVLLFGGLGVILAFFPISGRPADAMFFYFFKAVFSPTQYVYKQTQQDVSSQTTSVGGAPQEKKKEEEKKEFQTIQITPLATLPDKEEEEKKEKPLHVVENTEPMPAIVAEAPMTPPVELSQETVVIAKALEDAKEVEKEAKGQQEATQAHQKVSELEAELGSLQQQKKQLEERLLLLQKQISLQPQKVFTPSTVEPPKQTENVRKIPASMGKTVGTPFLTDTPNLISGVVKDPRGNVLPNILIEVKDKDNNPVRAFKTNPLGQFASATPVMNGTYTITFEDQGEKQKFDTVELTANGEVMQPIEVISVDAREELRKELFG